MCVIQQGGTFHLPQQIQRVKGVRCDVVILGALAHIHCYMQQRPLLNTVTQAAHDNSKYSYKQHRSHGINIWESNPGRHKDLQLP